MITLDKYYQSDSILHGRKIKPFLQSICESVYKEHNLYLDEHFANYKWYDSPLFHKETSLSYLFVDAIKKQTRMLLPEALVHRKTTVDDKSNGLCDLWCNIDFNIKGGIDYFIEFKRGYYNIGERSNDELPVNVKQAFDTMVNQLRTIKKGDNAKEYGDNPAFVGIMPFYCYCHKNQEVSYEPSDLLEEINGKLNQTYGAEIIMFVENVPQKVQKAMRDDKDYDYVAKFIAIVCVVITKTSQK